ncbi:oxidoreductase, short-chain dehydrogenase/reductase family protein [Elysia marginata]|uniref:Oxidoreductase, short-chain dehydrogenase/reductase family protein n=1 Tax=Elysia marginata TaxID=1093978 RepID=A0AAV4JJA5_9GAST|nr:oxidoreductase, short-chain dehydrogenase/reductase family protein [Elysia marginata]
MRFSNKIAVVTGGSSGIGLATVRMLHEEGAKVYNLDIRESESGTGSFIQCDVANYTDIKNAIDKIAKAERTIDVLFANAGVHKFANIEDTSVEDFNRVMSINCHGVFYTLKAVLPIMRQQQHGRILLMGSDQAIIGKGLSAVYGMSKGGVAQLTKSTAIDYAPFNIHINCICPGSCDTPLLRKATHEFREHLRISTESAVEILEQAQPIKRLSTPEEIARVACFLLSPENSFMTGSLVPVDGGYTCQ